MILLSIKVPVVVHRNLRYIRPVAIILVLAKAIVTSMMKTVIVAV